MQRKIRTIHSILAFEMFSVRREGEGKMGNTVSTQLISYAGEKFEATLPLLKESGKEIADYVKKLTGDEKVLMEFLYGTMPFCDAADVEPKLLHAYVKHALMLRQTAVWTRELPEDIFLNYVLYYRVNNEDIVDCRDYFYQMLWPLVSNCSCEEAVKEVNYWCAKQATYTASDERTLGPVGVFKSGSGRCGEESTFLVTALRSIGIAARQVYTPRWAHCDDNHAWVESWVDGSWRFLGACEPEEVLDKGWFTNASSRAMMVHTRVFSDYQSKQNVNQEEITERLGAALFYNDVMTYAKAKKLTVLVKDAQGNPVPRAKVEFEILNMAEYYPISTLYTDCDGKAALTMGLGSIHIHVSKGGCCCEALINNEKTDFTEMILSEQLWQQELALTKENWRYIDHIAPRDYLMHPVKLTREQKETGKARKKEADRLRQEKIKNSYQVNQAEKYPDMQEVLRFSYGNFNEVYRFLEENQEEEAKKILSVLAEKDYRDIRTEVLAEHLAYAGKVKDFCYNELLKDEPDRDEIYENYVLNPRIRYEMITKYRAFLSGFFTEEQKKEFCSEPETIWNWIMENIACEQSRNYQAVVTSPVGTVRSGQGSLMAKKTLFVAVCRTLGVPARINPVNLEAEYYWNGAFCSVTIAEQEKKVRLVLKSDAAPAYFSTWSIAKLNSDCENGETYTGFTTLDYMGVEFEQGQLTLLLSEGIYRVITTTRLPNGNQMEARRVIDTGAFTPAVDGVPEGILSLEIRQPQVSQMLEELKLEDFSLNSASGTEVPFEQLLGGKHTMLAFLEEGMEPTEHLLNELRERETEVVQSGLQVLFVVTHQEALENQTLADVQRRLQAPVYYDDFQELPEILARRMYTDPDKLPLVLLISPDMYGRYACSGYNVGSVALMLQIAKMMEK